MKYFTIIFLSILMACQPDNGLRNIEEYYFPLKKLKDGKIYEYQSVGNEYDPPMYWYYKSMKQDGSQYLLGTGYDTEFSPDQFLREEKVDNGMLLVDFIIYEKTDSTASKSSTQAEIVAGNIFPFTVKQPANVLLTSLHWESQQDSARINLIRNRQYDSDTVFVFNNKKIPAIKFKTIELIEHDKEGRLPLEFDGMEIYAKGIGLVGLRKNITKGYRLAYELKAIYSMEEFEEKFAKKIEK